METAHVLYFENVDLPSFGTWYMHVRAQNYAGLISDVRTYQILHPDPTPPAAPLVSVQPRNNGLRVFLPQLANDPESGIAGYQYTYRSHDGSAQRDWPEGSGSSPAVDFTHSSLTTLGNSAPYFRIPMLPVSSAFDLQVRAVSGNGTYSQTVSIAGVKFDLRKAEIASIEKELFEREMRGEERKFMNVKVASINGFDAGISSVRLTITDAGGSTLYQNIKRYADQLPYLPRLDDVEFLKIPVHQMLNHGNLNLTVEVETGAGVRSSFEEQISMNNGGGIVLGS
ncbi:MAG: hypothetical protein EA391_14300 [Balneolaceae bacterium]|nr:MAG: hypothetical protein EA391_14300 [Balneolaceae bacterium]